MNHAHPLILVRHSLPEIAEGIPAHMWKLSTAGRVRVEKLAGLLQYHQPEVIVSSIEPKARQTAEIIGERLGVEVVVMDGLHEHERRSVPFYSNEKIRSLVRELFEKPDVLVFGNESAAQALARFRESVELILDLHDDKKVAIVSHGTVISLFVSRLTGVDGFFHWSELGLPSYTVLDMQKQKLLETVNIT